MLEPTDPAYFLISDHGLKVWIVCDGQYCKFYRKKGEAHNRAYIVSTPGEFKVYYKYTRIEAVRNDPSHKFLDTDIRILIEGDQVDGHLIHKGKERKAPGLFTAKHHSDTEERPMLFQEAAIDVTAPVIKTLGRIVVIMLLPNSSHGMYGMKLLGEPRSVPEGSGKRMPFKTFEGPKDPDDALRDASFAETIILFGTRDMLRSNGVNIPDSPPPSTRGSASPQHAVPSSSESHDKEHEREEDENLQEQVDGLDLHNDDGGSRGTASPSPDAGVEALPGRAASSSIEVNIEEHEMDEDKDSEEQVDKLNNKLDQVSTKLAHGGIEVRLVWTSTGTPVKIYWNKKHPTVGWIESKLEEFRPYVRDTRTLEQLEERRLEDSKSNDLKDGAKLATNFVFEGDGVIIGDVLVNHGHKAYTKGPDHNARDSEWEFIHPFSKEEQAPVGFAETTFGEDANCDPLHGQLWIYATFGHNNEGKDGDFGPSKEMLSNPRPKNRKLLHQVVIGEAVPLQDGTDDEDSDDDGNWNPREFEEKHLICHFILHYRPRQTLIDLGFKLDPLPEAEDGDRASSASPTPVVEDEATKHQRQVKVHERNKRQWDLDDKVLALERKELAHALRKLEIEEEGEALASGAGSPMAKRGGGPPVAKRPKLESSAPTLFKGKGKMTDVIIIPD
ncbi:hypothetical protein RQP46_011424 [Phenoliferia psychrophenolica]